MKVEIPKELKVDMPQTTFAKILAATPVVMAVVATMLAGLASSEMTRAQYDRSGFAGGQPASALTSSGPGSALPSSGNTR